MTTVVYLAGYGRSGSTLADLLLGSRDGWFSMGEFRQFFHGVRSAWKCGCGRAIPECEVWSSVIVAGSDPDEAVRRLHSIVRVRYVPRVLRPTTHLPTQQFLEELAGRYHAAAEHTGARVLVDSSNDPVYGLFLQRAPGIDLRVLHLVRDSRAVAWSLQRKRRRPEIEADAYLPVHSPLHTCFEWDFRNALAHVLGRRAGAYVRVRYEDLARDPADVVMRATKDLGLQGGSPNFELADNHTVAGNPMRFTRGPLHVRADDEWQRCMPRRDRRLVTALTLPGLLRYGYLART
ncbi:MAG TPA: sulfotransferase [Acidimicrobiia bacterium]|nr:sulfotransferase [Acidimicrobiia bacterium]